MGGPGRVDAHSSDRVPAQFGRQLGERECGVRVGRGARRRASTHAGDDAGHRLWCVRPERVGADDQCRRRNRDRAHVALVPDRVGDHVVARVRAAEQVDLAVAERNADVLQIVGNIGRAVQVGGGAELVMTRGSGLVEGTAGLQCGTVDHVGQADSPLIHEHQIPRLGDLGQHEEREPVLGTERRRTAWAATRDEHRSVRLRLPSGVREHLHVDVDDAPIGVPAIQRHRHRRAKERRVVAARHEVGRRRGDELTATGPARRRRNGRLRCRPWC